MNSIARFYIKVLNILIPDGPTGDRLRGRLYEPYLSGVGSNFKVAANAFIFNPSGLVVGDNVYIGYGSYLGQGQIELKDEVLIGNHVSLTASNHLKRDDSFRFGGFHAEKITVGKGTWIAAHACILSGVSIGSGVLVAAGAVVTKDIVDNAVVAGVPAKELNK